MPKPAGQRATSRSGDRHRIQYALRVRAEPDERAAWVAAARRQGLTVQAWAARILDHAVNAAPP